ncbi:undecaprenyl/decaprenyl-phosphate alpha-N-acetylglucosaminyl 1-phosphate transferase [Cyanobacteria bacterium FACHB-DQ100]|uniref:glycosyltransferase family 4 protein n=1 Tax=unclassified Leptolyngbya TaxID=2650499 RepID=UPI001680421C|nr:MraY family glycosyltransferase [Leptolyngbya sp. FACHB-17]MBD1823271.1 undecaprenyl/decaprenyl-phosphate alpha-N-acetylglucosaminyl 1-phosphate transferase [Cyanobacteria bacterium FACHB-DQ100]MBD2083161.1 undecaprenyl/decaprenyl-phosphate alpha-N-acetylglucosaminyl 1-phosphate transferase [Leptolyngbya sp. FACHB-17]
MPFFAAFLISFLVVLVATPIINRFGKRVGLVDQPNHRKVHQRPMVRLGGVAMFLGVVIALLIVWWIGGFGLLKPTKESEVWGLAIGGIAFFLIGLADDLFNLSPKTRLILQVVVAGLAWESGVQIDFLTNPIAGLVSLPEWASLPITVIWLVGMANAINWIDGLDGLAAGVSGIAAFVMFWTCLFMQQPQAALFAAALAGATFGFLRYNFNPAQIFMGDGGAYFIGFMLAGVGVIGLVKSVTTVAVLLPYVILAVPILDMSAVILDRIRRGKSPFVADKRHLHHRLLKAGLSQRLAVLFIYSLTLWAGSLAMAVSGMPSGVGYAIAATIILSVTSWQVWRTAR